MKDLLIPFLEQLIKYINDKNYWAVTSYIFCIGGFFSLMGFLLSWILNRKKVQKEIEKLSVESKDKRIELLAKIQDLRNIYYENLLKAQKSTKLLIIEIDQNNLIGAETAWSNLKSTFFNDVLSSFEKYLETNEIYLEGNRKKEKHFIEDEIFNILNTSLIMLETINMPIVLRNLNKTTITLEENTLRPSFRYVDSYIRIYNLKIIYNKWRFYSKLYKKK
jgi:hypothetical protein